MKKTRGSIYVTTKYHGGVYLYTYEDGHKLPLILQNSLKKDEKRWGDQAYLARIIFCEMVKNDIDGTSGFGISPFCTEIDHPIIFVDTYEEETQIRNSIWSFREYINIDVKKIPDYY